jgi:hypothetical protein
MIVTSQKEVAKKPGLTRFLTAGLRDAERRLPWLAVSEPRGEQRVVTVIESGLVFGAVDRALARVRRAGESSKLVVGTRRVAATWTKLPRRSRRLAAGVVLLTAASVHLGLTASQQVPPGWLWSIPSGFAAVIGGLLTAAALFDQHRESR